MLRQEHDCWLCGHPVDKALKTPHPGSPEVDEIVRVRDGGSAIDRKNCRLSHRLCNRYRDVPDGPPADLFAYITGKVAIKRSSAFETDRAW